MKTIFSSTLTLAALALALNAAAAPFAYVPNEKSGTISIIDTATDKGRGTSTGYGIVYVLSLGTAK